MQDNYQKHTARSLKEWISTKYVMVFESPAQTPDLNLIAYLWADIKKALETKNLTKYVGTFKKYYNKYSLNNVNIWLKAFIRGGR